MNTYTRVYPDGSSSEEYVLEAGRSRLTLDPAGGYVISWTIGSMAVLYTGSTKKRSGIPILFPYFSVSKSGRQHGFGRDSIWKLSESTETSSTLELRSSDISPDAQKEYGHPFTARIQISLEPQAMIYELSVHNDGAQPLPLSPGLHPYWAVDHTQKKNVKTQGIPGFDATAIDWDAHPPDTMYPFPGVSEITFPDKILRISEESGQKQIKYMCVWSQPPDKPDHDFICFEPVCGDKGEFDSSPLRISQDWKMRLRFHVE